MPINTDSDKAAEKWQAAIDKLGHETTIEVGAKMSLPPGEDPEEFAETMERGLFRTVQNFMRDVVKVYLVAEYDKKGANEFREHFLMFRTDPAKSNTEEPIGPGDGFRDIRDIMNREVVMTSNNNSISGTLGSGIYDLKSQNYGLQVNSSTPLTSWWLNVELGTGIAENVGANVRTTGPTKDTGEPGAWWLGPSDGAGKYMVGQKGVHIMWDENTGEPNDFWVMMFSEKFPEYLSKQLSDMIEGKGRYSRG